MITRREIKYTVAVPRTRPLSEMSPWLMVGLMSFWLGGCAIGGPLLDLAVYEAHVAEGKK